MKKYIAPALIMVVAMLGMVAGCLMLQPKATAQALSFGDPTPTDTTKVPPLFRDENGFLTKNFEWGDELKNQVPYKGGQYTQTAIDGSFKDGMYYLPTASAAGGTTALFQSDPFLITKFEIQNMEVPYTNIMEKDMFGEYYSSQFLFIQIEVGGWGLAIGIDEINNNLVLHYNPVGLLLGNVGSLIKSIPRNQFFNIPDHRHGIPDNRLSLTLEIDNLGRIRYKIASAKYTYTDLLPREPIQHVSTPPQGAIRYDNSANSALGIGKYLKLNRDKNYKIDHYYYKNDWDSFWNAKTWVSKTYNQYPNIVVDGRYAKIQKAVDCYIDGEYAFTDHMFLNHWDTVDIPSQYDDPQYSFEWYRDPNLQVAVIDGQTTAREFNTLYGKRINKSYYVTLEYYTVDEFYTPLRGGDFYNMLVKKRVTRLLPAGSFIDLDLFGDNVANSLYYDYIQSIPFVGWDTDITQPITSHLMIKGLYDFPTAQLYYYDQDGKMYGKDPLEQQFQLYPISILKNELDKLEITNPYWWHDLNAQAQSDGVIGNLYRLMEGIARWAFGGDNIGNGKYAQLREDEKDLVKAIVDQVAIYNNDNNTYFTLIIRLDINLHHLNKGAYGNSAFYVDYNKNPNWHCVSGHPENNDLVYMVDAHSVYSLGFSKYSLSINFEKKMDGFDSFSQRMADIAAWFGGFFGGIFGGLFGGFFNGMGGWQALLVVVVCFLLFLFVITHLWFVFGIFQALLTIMLFPFIWIANRLGAKLNTSPTKYFKRYKGKRHFGKRYARNNYHKRGCK